MNIVGTWEHMYVIDRFLYMYICISHALDNIGGEDIIAMMDEKLELKEAPI